VICCRLYPIDFLGDMLVVDFGQFLELWDQEAVAPSTV